MNGRGCPRASTPFRLAVRCLPTCRARPPWSLLDRAAAVSGRVDSRATRPVHGPSAVRSRRRVRAPTSLRSCSPCAPSMQTAPGRRGGYRDTTHSATHLCAEGAISASLPRAPASCICSAIRWVGQMVSRRRCAQPMDSYHAACISLDTPARSTRGCPSSGCLLELTHGGTAQGR